VRETVAALESRIADLEAQLAARVAATGNLP